jgi:hypothetical protein
MTAGVSPVCRASPTGSLLYGVGEAAAATHDSRLYDMCVRYRHAGFEAILVKAQWLRNQPRYGANNRTDAYGVGWQYEFSKRTALYSS